MSVKDIDKANTTRANPTMDNVYKIHTDKYIEHLPNKLKTTSMINGQVWESTYTNGRNRVFEKARKGVRIQKGKKKHAKNQ